jgi:hypothetical protein
MIACPLPTEVLAGQGSFTTRFIYMNFELGSEMQYLRYDE